MLIHFLSLSSSPIILYYLEQVHVQSLYLDCACNCDVRPEHTLRNNPDPCDFVHFYLQSHSFSHYPKTIGLERRPGKSKVSHLFKFSSLFTATAWYSCMMADVNCDQQHALGHFAAQRIVMSKSEATLQNIVLLKLHKPTENYHMTL